MFKVHNKFTTYSKKRGAHQRVMLLEKNIPTLEEAKTKAQKGYAGKLEWVEVISGKKYTARTTGLLYPGELIITKTK